MLFMTFFFRMIIAMNIYHPVKPPVDLNVSARRQRQRSSMAPRQVHATQRLAGNPGDHQPGAVLRRGAGRKRLAGAP